ncbi:hypothetical protein [Streptomyces sp. NPDC048411]|uniref:hypothetical protein n=1 Tax=Streptomyces sp. NPDC048411 TaxID=3157206 RepID=UPI003453E77D
MHYVIRHAARTLVRADHPRALDIVGSSLAEARQAKDKKQGHDVRVSSDDEEQHAWWLSGTPL